MNAPVSELDAAVEPDFLLDDLIGSLVSEESAPPTETEGGLDEDGVVSTKRDINKPKTRSRYQRLKGASRPRPAALVDPSAALREEEARLDRARLPSDDEIENNLMSEAQMAKRMEEERASAALQSPPSSSAPSRAPRAPVPVPAPPPSVPKPAPPPAPAPEADPDAPLDVELLEDDSAARVRSSMQGDARVQSVPSSSAEPLDKELEERRRAREAVELRSNALLKMLKAGPGLELVIEEQYELIDTMMLKVLLQRLQAARDFGEKDAVRAMELLLKRLKAELQRKTSTPALRLLDEMLGLMQAADEGREDPESSRETVRLRLIKSFKGPELPSDIFSLSYILAEEAMDVTRMLSEFVSRSEFIEEIQEFYTEAAGRLDKEIAQFEAITLKATDEIRKVQDKEVRQKAARGLITLRNQLQARQAALKRVEELLAIARSIKV